MPKFIIEVADFVFPGHGSKYELEYKGRVKPHTNMDELFPGCVIFVEMAYFFTARHLRTVQVPFILITAGCDATIPYYSKNGEHVSAQEISDDILSNKNLIRWFTINLDGVHSKFEPIPLGLPPCMMWIDQQTKKEYEFMSAYINYLEFPVQEKLEKFDPVKNIVSDKKKLLYVKMTKENTDNPMHTLKNIRRVALHHLKEKGLYGKEIKEYKNDLVSWSTYIQELSEHKFALCPPGNGLDSFRIWECLAVGTIPIALDILGGLYRNLPVVLVSDFTRITPKLLESEFDRICKNVNSFKWEKTTKQYWVNKIKDTSRAFRSDNKCN